MIHYPIKLIGSLLTKNLFYRAASKAKRDPYEILGVSKTSDSKQIKKAYYKLAQELHPDKNSSPDAKEKFAQVNNAYELLSDPQKRQVYDQTGSTQQSPFGSAGFNQQDIFNQFRGFQGGMGQGGPGGFGGFEDILNEMFGGKRQTTETMNQTSVMNMTIDFTESVFGATKSIEYARTIKCQNCKGSKCKPGTNPAKCNSCNGTGAQTIRQGPFVMQTTCNSCNGEGTKIKEFCPNCRGSGIQNKNAKEDVVIPKGVSDGDTIKLSKKGNFDGDLLIKITVRKHREFVREGNNVKTELEVSALDAILGCKKTVNTIYGEKRQVNIPAGTQFGEKIVVQNEGFCYRGSTTQKGNHVISIKITIPKVLSAKEKQIYESIRKVDLLK